MKNPYEDIIGLPHHVSKTRPQMPMSDRAAQFSPFSALTGYDSAIHETGRLTSEKIELSEDAREILNRKLLIVAESPEQNTEVIITCFVPDELKNGGSYREISGIIKKIDEVEQAIIMQDQTRIPLDSLLEIETKKEV